jgi:D-proline reductase (dithiol) PrdB
MWQLSVNSRRTGMAEEKPRETFEEFKNSFSYGTRSDLNFKFLKSLSGEEASEFFQGLLWNLGDATNDEDFGPVENYIYEWQIKAYAGSSNWKYPESPFTPLRKPLSESKVGLMTTSGHFVDGDDPEPLGVKGMDSKEAEERISEFLKAEPVLSVIPMNTPRENLRLRHGGYDNRAALEDYNTVFPIDRLNELQQGGLIDQTAKNAYSFVGACAQNKLRKEIAPRWADLLKGEGIEAIILVPV